jgi:hypothetical protein
MLTVQKVMLVVLRVATGKTSSFERSGTEN